MKFIKAKKRLGQHFLNDKEIAKKIVESLKAKNISKVLEIGAGTGVLTAFLIKNMNYETTVIELDEEAVSYLYKAFPQINNRILSGNFLRIDLKKIFSEKFAIIGNFPYNISSQILFKVLENKNQVVELVGMFQKEVAERISAKPGKKVYGILSVFLKAFYDVEYLFTVDADVFIPPPKVKSAVVRITRNNVENLECDEKLFFKVVKTAFNQRRKMLRNSLKIFLKDKDISNKIFLKRPEQLSVEDFVFLTKFIQ
ncbi:MAG: 16S rRNA (adenine(1518)-N(6)/adenine(1519)-N(6))-dimethyltransferase [Bacteroidetes bacterium 4572_128]|nr:MAG: 16S rRNA (adenine(1518)-N(6)/adenine(1519)-N(6))-dimethyltransferase [Bacteroidetes bacterium 4572_128]